MSDHAQWFADLNGGLSPQLEIRRRIGTDDYLILLPVDGPFPTHRAAAIARERCRREIADLIATAPDVVDASRVAD